MAQCPADPPRKAAGRLLQQLASSAGLSGVAQHRLLYTLLAAGPAGAWATTPPAVIAWTPHSCSHSSCVSACCRTRCMMWRALTSTFVMFVCASAKPAARPHIVCAAGHCSGRSRSGPSCWPRSRTAWWPSSLLVAARPRAARARAARARAARVRAAKARAAVMPGLPSPRARCWITSTSGWPRWSPAGSEGFMSRRLCGALAAARRCCWQRGPQPTAASHPAVIAVGGIVRADVPPCTTRCSPSDLPPSHHFLCVRHPKETESRAAAGRRWPAG